MYNFHIMYIFYTFIFASYNILSFLAKHCLVTSKLLTLILWYIVVTLILCINTVTLTLWHKPCDLDRVMQSCDLDPVFLLSGHDPVAQALWPWPCVATVWPRGATWWPWPCDVTMWFWYCSAAFWPWPMVQPCDLNHVVQKVRQAEEMAFRRHIFQDILCKLVLVLVFWSLF